MRLLEFVDAAGRLIVVPVPDERCSLDPDGLVLYRDDGSRLIFNYADTLHLSEN